MCSRLGGSSNTPVYIESVEEDVIKLVGKPAKPLFNVGGSAASMAALTTTSLTSSEAATAVALLSKNISSSGDGVIGGVTSRSNTSLLIGTGGSLGSATNSGESLFGTR